MGKRLLSRLQPEIFILIFFSIIYIILYSIFDGEFTIYKSQSLGVGKKHGVLVPFVMMLLLAIIGFFIGLFKRSKENPFILPLNIVKDWLPVPLLILVYENLHDLTNLIHPGVYDSVLKNIDQWIFGFQPVVWLQKIANPYLTEWLMLNYIMYFFWPTFLLTLLYIKGRKEEFHMFMVILSCCIYLGFLGYVFVPAIGPRYELKELFTDPPRLYGAFLFHKAYSLLDNLEAVKHDCFPSLHTAVSTVVLAFAWRMRDLFKTKRIVFWIMLPFVLNLYFSTVYLRYHWVVDVLAGFVHAFLTYKLGVWFYNKWRAYAVQSEIN